MAGAEAVMALGGSAILEAHAGLQILAPRATVVRLGALRPDSGWSIPEAGYVRWLGTTETRTRTIVLVFRRGVGVPPERRIWRVAAGEGDSSESELEDNSASDDDNPDADMEMGDEEGGGSMQPVPRQPTIPLTPATLNVQGMARKSKELEATTSRFGVDLFLLTETKVKDQGWVESSEFSLFHSGSAGSGGKAAWVRTADSEWEVEEGPS